MAKKVKITWFLSGRIIFSILYFIAAVSLFFLFKEKIFNLNVSLKSWNIYYRFIWCYASGLLGFSVLVTLIVSQVLKGIHKDDNPLPTYLTYYPFLILMTSGFTFVVLSLFTGKLGVLFYAASFSLSFFFGLYIDSLPVFLRLTLGNLRK